MKISFALEKAREEVAEFGLKMLNSNFVLGCWGNISCFLPDEKLVVITPSGVAYDCIKPDMTVVVNLNGEIQKGNLKPSSELKVHLAIYQARPDVRAVVHTHSVYASALAVSRTSLPPILEDMASLIGGSVSVAEYALAGSRQLAVNTVRALGESNAVLMANHGVVGVGGTLKEALAVCEMVERCAQIYLLAKQVGNPVEIGDQDVRILRDFYLNKYGQNKERCPEVDSCPK